MALKTLALSWAWFGAAAFVIGVALFGFLEGSMAFVCGIMFGLAPTAAVADRFLIRRYSNVARLVPFKAVAAVKAFMIVLPVALFAAAFWRSSSATASPSAATPMLILGSSVVAAVALTHLSEIRWLINASVAASLVAFAGIRFALTFTAATVKNAVTYAWPGLDPVKRLLRPDISHPDEEHRLAQQKLQSKEESMHPAAAMRGPARRTIGPIGQFAAKTFIVACVCLVSLWLISLYVDRTVDRRIRQLQSLVQSSSKIGGREFWARIERELESQADPSHDLSPERKQKILAEIRTIAARWRPFVTEALSDISGNNPEAAKP